MPKWLDEFLVVTGTSFGLQIKLVSIPVVPALIAMFGAYQLDISQSSRPYSLVLASVREAAFPIYLAAALIALVGCIRVFAREYCCVRKRLFG